MEVILYASFLCNLHLFNKLKKHRLTTYIDPHNKNAIRLVERIGFRKEGHFIESLLIHGKWADDLIYALIEKDWNKINQITKN